MIQKIIIILLLLLPTTAISAEHFSGMIGVHSDYVWRGYSQNDGEVALSAGVGVALGGFTLAAWASQVDFNDDAKYEYDLVAGYDYWVNDNFKLSGGYIRYAWDEIYDTIEEAYVGFSTYGVSLTYYQDIDNSDLDFVNAIVEVPFIKEFDVSLEYGKATGFDNYKAINISKELGDWTVGGQIGSEESTIGIVWNF
tara:strand:- start:19287 stop:19874 length:588 start_codon:yes stop_codon:yes gene_type:complete